VGSNSKIVDEVGTSLGCGVMDWHGRHIVVEMEKVVKVRGPKEIWL
jgi:hypothetical protein